MAGDLRVRNQEFWLKVIAAVVVIGCLLAGVWAYPQLPESVPSHWNAAGEVDGYNGPLMAAFLLPLTLLGLYALFLLIPHIDPKKLNFKQMGSVYWVICLIIILYLAVVYLGTLAVGLGIMSSLPKWSMSGIGLLFIVLGNYFDRIKFNYFVGIRTPWTLANEQVWDKTHRMAKPIWIVGGVLLLAVGFLPASWVAPYTLIIVVVLALVPLGYSYFVFRRLEQ